jgi:hypothetical protein
MTNCDRWTRKQRLDIFTIVRWSCAKHCIELPEIDWILNKLFLKLAEISWRLKSDGKKCAEFLGGLEASSITCFSPHSTIIRSHLFNHNLENNLKNFFSGDYFVTHLSKHSTEKLEILDRVHLLHQKETYRKNHSTKF